MFFVPLAYILTPWFAVADCGWPPGLSAIAGGTGVALLLGALWLFWRSHRDLGANWSPSLEIVSEHRLVTQGVYGAIRHPMYASQALWSIAQLLLLQNWVAGPASLVAFLPLYLVRVPQEESMMLQHFGDEYLIYCQRTGRLLPPLRGRR
jgi:protein-S-isoprenylcysteine O-methyltransferase Ste14